MLICRTELKLINEELCFFGLFFIRGRVRGVSEEQYKESSLEKLKNNIIYCRVGSTQCHSTLLYGLIYGPIIFFLSADL